MSEIGLSDKKKGETSRFERIMIYSLVLCVGIGVIGVICYRYISHNKAHEYIHIPDTNLGIHSHYSASFLEEYVLVRVDVEPQLTDRILDNTCGTWNERPPYLQIPWEYHDENTLFWIRPWWNPLESTNWTMQECEDGWDWYQVLIDKSQENLHTLYFSVSSG